MTPSDSIIPYGYCQCGCGENTLIAPRTSTRRGQVKGQPMSFLPSHNNRVYTLKWKTASNTPTYVTWTDMKARVLNPDHQHASCYSERGITLCERWLDYDNFVADMGLRPEGTTLDRINNDGNYEPGNCRWATWKEQCENKRTSRMFTAYGITQSIADWSEATGIKKCTLFYRLKKLPPEQAFSIRLWSKKGFYDARKQLHVAP